MKLLILFGLFLSACNSELPKKGNTEDEIIAAAHYAYPNKVCFTSKSTDNVHQYLDGTYCMVQVRDK